MAETMVNGMKFKVWNDTTRRATFAESEDGRVEMIHGCGYITADLTIRKAIAMVYGLPTFRKNAVKTASAVEETPVTESKEQEVETAEQTETEIEEAVKSGNFYAVAIAHDTNEIEELSLVYDSYSEAMKIAKYYADVYGKNNVFIGTMQTLEPKTCKWYCYNSISETTAEQETEINAEVETEQTENNVESVSETHDSKDVKADTSKTDELSGATKTLMALSPVVSEYLRQIEYIDTS